MSINIDGKRHSIQTIELNDVLFVDYFAFFRLFSNSLKHSQDIFVLNNDVTSISTYYNSFFISLKNATSNSDEHIIQLTTPTYLHDNILYISLNSAILGITDLFGLQCDILKSGIYVELNDKIKDFFKEKATTIERKSIEKIDIVNGIPVLDIQIKNSLLTNNINKNLYLNNVKLFSKNRVTIGYFKEYMNFESYKKVNSIAIPENELSNFQSNIATKEAEKTEIIKPNISKLSFYSDMKNKNTISTSSKTRSNINTSDKKNSLPPFRKYSIPDTLIKRQLNELE